MSRIEATHFKYPGDLRKQSGFKKQMKEFKHSSFTFFLAD